MKARWRTNGNSLWLVVLCLAVTVVAQLPPVNPELAVDVEKEMEVLGADDPSQGTALMEHEELLKENLAIREQLRTVTALLARERARSDQLQQELGTARLRSEQDGTMGRAARTAALRVIAVNAMLGFVMLDAGASDGLRPGLQYRLMRDGQAVAQVRVADVREYVSGAVTERIRPGAQPQAGDVAIVGETGEGSELRPWKYEP